MTTTFTLTLDMIKRLSEISNPHMKAINEAVEAAFPDIPPDMMYTGALGFQLALLLQSLNDEIRSQAIALINAILANAESGCVLMKLQG